MLKNNKGITLIALAITVVILTLIVSISSYSGFKAMSNAKYYEAVSEMKTMQAKVNELYEIYKNGGEISTYGTDVSAASSKAKTAYDAANADNVAQSNLGSFEDYRYFSVDYIKQELDLEGIKYDFIVNIQTRSVILVDGVEREGKMYYSLCQMEGEQYNVDYNGE